MDAALALGWFADAGGVHFCPIRFFGLGRPGQLAAVLLGVLGFSPASRDGETTAPGRLDARGWHSSCVGYWFRTDVVGLVWSLATGGWSDCLVCRSWRTTQRSPVWPLRLRQHCWSVVGGGMASHVGVRTSSRWLEAAQWCPGLSPVDGCCGAVHPVQKCHGCFSACGAIGDRPVAVVLVAAALGCVGCSLGFGDVARHSNRFEKLVGWSSSRPHGSEAVGTGDSDGLEAHPSRPVGICHRAGGGPPLVWMGSGCVQRAVSDLCGQAVAWPFP